jgi:hypothetical protein
MAGMHGLSQDAKPQSGLAYTSTDLLSDTGISPKAEGIDELVHFIAFTA